MSTNTTSVWRKKLKELEIVVVIPTYNNGKTLAAVIEEVCRYADDIIVVNDGSTDDTANILEQYPAIRTITHPVNKGKGTALKHGLSQAKKEGFRYAITIDSDGQHFASDIPCFIEAIEKEPDTLLVGARNLASDNMPGKNTFANKFSNFWFRLETGLKLEDTQDVLEAASTKWNFLPFKPGLVGGHCIGVDPYYLAQCAQRHGYNPEIILAGRRMNDGMGEYVANQVAKLMLKKGIQVLNSHILILGFTFKENCPDVRNTKVIDIYNALREYNVHITVYDPWANPDIVMREYGISVTNQHPLDKKFDAAIIAVAHEQFIGFDVKTLLNAQHVIFDVKAIFEKNVVDGRL